MGKKYILYVNIDRVRESESHFMHKEHFLEKAKQYKAEMRQKLYDELLEPNDKLLVLETKGETYISVLE